MLLIECSSNSEGVANEDILLILSQALVQLNIMYIFAMDL